MSTTITKEGKVEVAYHSTQKGWGVLILRDHVEAAFQVARVAPDCTYLTRYWAETEVEARQLANRLWSLDMGRPMKEDVMIGLGPLSFS